MRLVDLHDDLFPHIYSFIYELPLRPSSHQRKHYNETDRIESGATTLAFPHTCSKILRSMDEHAPFQFDKFIQFYCLGIRNERFEKLELANNLNEIIPVVFYLNFPELTFVEHLNFERDLIPMERKFRKVFHVERSSYEDFLFKIDRIIEMMSAFINIIKKKLDVQELSQAVERMISVDNLEIPVSDLISVISHADKIVNQCMKLFHWKAYTETYFEELYLQVPNELPLISKKYSDCERIIEILKHEDFKESMQELYQLLSTVECYYCDKIAAVICLYFFRNIYTDIQNDESFQVNHPIFEKLLRYLVYYGMHNVPVIFTQCGDVFKDDEELSKRLIYCTPGAYTLLSEKFQKNMFIIQTCVYQSLDSVIDIGWLEHGKELLVEFFSNNPDEFYYVLGNISRKAANIMVHIVISFIQALERNLSHPTLGKNLFCYDWRFLQALNDFGEKDVYFSEKRRKRSLEDILQHFLEPIDIFKAEHLKDETPTLDLILSPKQ